jgi:hypothetical protein
MTKSLSILPEKYPNLFRNPSSRVDSNGLVPVFMACDDGWFDILDSLLNVINWRLSRWEEVASIKKKLEDKGEPVGEWIFKYFASHPNNPLDTFQVDQIKEKFGGLRFYYSGLEEYSGREYIDGAVMMAESLSSRLCEECGNSGATRTTKGGWWIRTLCLEHIAKRESIETEEETKESNL